MHIIFRLSFLIWLLIGSGFAFAASAENDAWLPDAEKQIKSWQSELINWRLKNPSIEQIESVQADALALQDKLDNCIATFENKAASEQEKIDALGEDDGAESAEIIKRRKQLSDKKKLYDNQLVICKVSRLSLRDLLDEFKPIKNEILSNTISLRGAPITSTVISLLTNPRIFKADYKLTFNYWPSALIGLLALMVLWPLAKFIASFIRKTLAPVDDNQTATDYQLIMSMVATRLPWIATSLSLILFTYLSEMVILSAILLAVTSSMLLAPFLEWILCHDSKRCRVGFPARSLLDIVLIGIAVAFAGIEQIFDEDMYLLISSSYYFLLMSFSLWVMFLLSQRSNFQLLNSLRTPIAVAMMAGPLAMWLGYHSLASLMIPGVYGTLAGFLFVYGLLTASSMFWGMFDPEEPQTNKKLRAYLGYENQEYIPGLWVGRLLVIILMLVAFLYWLSIAWKIPDSEVALILDYMNNGFDIGAIKFVPVKILGAVIALFVLLTFARWIKNQLSDRWLQRTRLDAGAKESIISLTTYVIVGISILIALSVAGVDFQNIAIVAGALSVGIGFGLQNIVNNFVSGLILLFERPVKPGDWVVVGGTEGYVRKISIRYTLIQTFDRAEVLVPNSELISSQVTNWMLQDRMGRVITPVGVAYGTDTAVVKELLLKAANEHPLVLSNDWRVSKPVVLFMGFGESSLDFELRCFIREVDAKLSVRSDLLFRIDELFREADIEIPFPQRVVHMYDQDNTSSEVNRSIASEPLNNDKPAS